MTPNFLQNKRPDSKLSMDKGRGPIRKLKEYKDSGKPLRRRNKGIMQWKGPRTLAWMKHVGERGKRKMGNIFHHHERDGTGIETEV